MDSLTNLAAPLGSPMAILAAQSEFVTLTGGAGMPVATKTRVGTLWFGLQGTFGTLTKASYTEGGDITENPGNSPGTVRSKVATKLTKEIELEMHWDRGQPNLRKLDRFSLWLDTEEGREAVLVHVTEISADFGEGDNVTRKVKAVHTPGLDDKTSLFRAEVDGMGHVIRWTSQTKFDPSEDPAADIPTGPEGAIGATWARSGTTVTVTTSAAHGYTTGDTVHVYQSSDETATPTGNKSITVTTSTTFTFTGVNTGATSGTMTIKKV